jgi:uncharacterized lipoprotein YajG
MKKVLLALFAAGMIFAGCAKQEEMPVTAPEVTSPTTEQAPVVSTTTATEAAPEAPAGK